MNEDEFEEIMELEEPQVPQQKIYIGPGIAKEGVLHNQVFLNGLPPHMQLAIQHYPEIQELIVDVKDYSEASEKVKRKGTPLNAYYEAILRKA